LTAVVKLLKSLRGGTNSVINRLAVPHRSKYAAATFRLDDGLVASGLTT
jgi:hypothetical protein